MSILFTHAAASDDSKHQDGRYNSLALVTCEYQHVGELQDSISKILRESGIKSEFKWNNLYSARERFAAMEMVDFVFKNRDRLRVDILIWDLEDKRHKDVIKRDDNENLVRMYYHLVSTTLSKRWPIGGSRWRWRPDVQFAVDWDTLHDCIRNKKHKCVRDLFNENPDFERVDIRRIDPSESHEWPLIQLADLFAGMGAYSWGHYKKFSAWWTQKSKQQSIFGVEKVAISPGEEEKYTVLSHFIEQRENTRLPISYETTNGLRTRNPNCRLNFWLYEPQHELDKAPIRSR